MAPPPTPQLARTTAAPAMQPAQTARMRGELDAVFAPYFSEGASFCVLDATGRLAYDRSCHRSVTPASTQKIIVAATAFAVLGGGFRYHTILASSGPIRNGLLDALWLIGSGDPILISNDLRGGAKVVAAQGLSSVAGGVVVDGGAIAGPERNPAWDPTDATYGYASATSGISLDQDTIEFHTRPTAAGAPARVFLEPPSKVVAYHSDVITVPAFEASIIAVDPIATNTFFVHGRIAAGHREVVSYLPVSGIANYAGDVMDGFLQARGIRTHRAPRAGTAPVGVTNLWNHPSPPLRFIIAKMLHESNNHIAEQLLRSLGRLSGTTDDAHGIRTEERFLDSHQIETAGLRLIDGSGLAGANKVSGATLAATLASCEMMPACHELYYALPRGGMDGTLRDYQFGSALGRVRAKSGHLSGAESMVGYVTTRRHGRLIFAFLINSAAPASAVDNAIARGVDVLAGF